MQAIILAAGMGRRLGELTRYDTKCMIEVNGIRITGKPGSRKTIEDCACDWFSR